MCRYVGIFMCTFLCFFSGSYIPDCSTYCILNYNQKTWISWSKILSSIQKSIMKNAGEQRRKKILKDQKPHNSVKDLYQFILSESSISHGFIKILPSLQGINKGLVFVCGSANTWKTILNKFVFEPRCLKIGQLLEQVSRRHDFPPSLFSAVRQN